MIEKCREIITSPSKYNLGCDITIISEKECQNPIQMMNILYAFGGKVCKKEVWQVTIEAMSYRGELYFLDTCVENRE